MAQHRTKKSDKKELKSKLQAFGPAKTKKAGKTSESKKVSTSSSRFLVDGEGAIKKASPNRRSPNNQGLGAGSRKVRKSPVPSLEEKDFKKYGAATKKISASDQEKKYQSPDPHDVVRFVEELKKQWMATVDALIDPLMWVDREYTILKANTALWRSTRLPSVRDVIGKKCYRVFARRTKPCEGCLMTNSASSGLPNQYFLDEIDEKVYEASSQPVYDSSEQLMGVVQVYRDRTESRRLQEKLAQSDKLASIGQLAGGVAHELNNPLGGILVFSQMLLKEIPADSTFYQDVKEIEGAALRCKDIVDGLLDFARVSPKLGQGFSQPLEPVDLREAIDQAIHFAQVGGRFKNRKHIIKNNLTNDRLFVLGQKNKIIQVFLNFIQNALDAMPKGGSLMVSQMADKKDSKRICISLKDTGIGMSEEQLKKAFDPFFTTKDPGKGTGLGLAICFSMVKDFGGEIELKSTVGKGTQVKVWLVASP